MATPKHQRKVRYNSGHGDQGKMAQAMDDLAEFEDFKTSILPKLRAAIKAGKSALDMYKLVEAEAAARAITIGLTSEDEGKALSAVTDILNRVHGKPKETVNVNNRYENLPDDQLDSLILSEKAAVEEFEH